MNHLFIIFLFLCTLSWGQEDVRLSCQVKGNVKSIDITKEESDEIEGDFLVDSFDYNMSIILDKKGRVIKLTSYSEKGKPSDIKETTYDNKNRVVKETVLFLPEKITRKISYSYNDKEKKGTAIAHSSHKSDRRTRREITLNDEGLPIRVIFFDSDGEAFKEISYEYNKNQKLAKSTIYEDGELERQVSYKYDDKGRIIEAKNYYIAFPKGDITYKYVYKDEIYPIEHTAIIGDDDPETLTFKYKFDSKGNWIEKTYFLDEEAVAIIKRKITYY